VDVDALVDIRRRLLLPPVGSARTGQRQTFGDVEPRGIGRARRFDPAADRSASGQVSSPSRRQPSVDRFVSYERGHNYPRAGPSSRYVKTCWTTARSERLYRSGPLLPRHMRPIPHRTEADDPEADDPLTREDGMAGEEKWLEVQEF
jgi:hypothetical protein